jgi:hypothetical protein
MSNENEKNPELIFLEVLFSFVCSTKGKEKGITLLEPAKVPICTVLTNTAVVHAWKYGPHNSAAVNKHLDSNHSTTKQYKLKGKKKKLCFSRSHQNDNQRAVVILGR